MRLCDLGLEIEGTALGGRVERLYGELDQAGLVFKPYVWLSTDWFTPDGVTGFGIPFYLAHPRLARLEHRQMLEVEGGGHIGCLKLLRHETAHALDHAYRLHRRKAWREQFGSAAVAYRPSYVPRPGSRRFVQNLDNWYAQSHPVEDFAETFAGWLQPRSQWRRRYAGWPALRKLEYVDELMAEIAERKPPVRTRERMDSLPKLRLKVGEYYQRKKAYYGEESRMFYDHDLRRLFSDEIADRRRPRASAFLRERRRELRQRVASWTGQYQFVVDEVLRHMIARCQTLGLRLRTAEREAVQDAAILLTVHTVRHLRGGHREYMR